MTLELVLQIGILIAWGVFGVIGLAIAWRIFLGD